MSKSFEEQMESLEKIVSELEKGDLNLDDSTIILTDNYSPIDSLIPII